MGPKKAKGKQKQVSLIGQYPIEEMTSPELIEYALKLQEEIQRCRETTEFVVKERLTIESFWNSCKEKLERENKLYLSLKAESRDLRVEYDKLLSENEEQLDYLQNENLQKLLSETVDANLNRLIYEEAHLEDERATVDRLTSKVQEQGDTELTYENLIQKMRQVRRDEMSELIQYYERKLSQTTHRYEDIFGRLWEDINRERQTIMQTTEATKNIRIQGIDENRQTECQDMRNYFNRIAFDCLALIGDLKNNLESLKKKEKEQKKVLRDAVTENRRLHAMQDDIKKAIPELAKYESSKKEFAKTRNTMRRHIQTIKDLEFENGMMEQQLLNVRKQISDLNNQFTVGVRKLQMSSGLRTVFLEKKIGLLQEFKSSTTSKPMATAATSSTDSLSFSSTASQTVTEEQQQQQRSLPKKRYPIKIIDL